MLHSMFSLNLDFTTLTDPPSVCPFLSTLITLWLWWSSWEYGSDFLFFRSLERGSPGDLAGPGVDLIQAYTDLPLPVEKFIMSQTVCQNKI